MLKTDAPNQESDDAFDGLFEVANLAQCDELEKEALTIDELISIGGTLGSIHKELTNAVPGGEISHATAVALNVAVEAFAKQGSFAMRPVFALEALHGKQSRRAALSTALENLADSIIYIARRIKDFIIKLYNWITENIEHALRGADGVRRRAARILELAIAKQAENSTGSSTLVTNRLLRNYFNKDGSSIGYADLIKTYKSYNAKLNENFYSAVLHNSLAKVIQTVQQKVATMGVTDSAALEASNNALMFFAKHGLDGFTQVSDSSEKTEYVYELPFDNATFSITFGKTEGKLSSISTTANQVKVEAPKSLPRLNPNQVIELARAIEGQMNAGIYRDHKKILTDIRNAGKAITDLCTQVSNNAAESQGAAPSLHFLKALTSSMVTLTKNLYQYNGRTARTLLAYCEASL